MSIRPQKSFVLPDKQTIRLKWGTASEPGLSYVNYFVLLHTLIYSKHVLDATNIVEFY